MSFDVNWEVNKYKEDHECEEHWLLRKAFIEKWKNDYPEERLICLARVFSNIEFMGCRYPLQVMQEVARLSQDIVQQYRRSKKTKLQRTFISASDAAEDRARGVKREGGIIKEGPSPKSTKISFVPQGQSDISNYEVRAENVNYEKKDEKLTSEVLVPHGYINDNLQLKCLDSGRFVEKMFNTQYGKMVLLIRPWASNLCNIQSSCQACRITIRSQFENNTFSIYINNILVGEASGSTKNEAKNAAGVTAWNTDLML